MLVVALVLQVVLAVSIVAVGVALVLLHNLTLQLECHNLLLEWRDIRLFIVINQTDVGVSVVEVEACVDFALVVALAIFLEVK